MWAINSRNYLPPMKADEEYEGQHHVCWLIYEAIKLPDGKYRTIAETYRAAEFSYTFANSETGERMTFIYNGASVKPAYRTLRKYGAEALQPIVAILANLDRKIHLPETIWTKLDRSKVRTT